MQDRVSLYPGRVRLTPVSGQTNVYDLERADQPTEPGTPLNKTTLLTDLVAECLGLSNTSVPNDVFSKLAVHRWKKTTYTWTLEEVQGFTNSSAYLGRAYSTSASSSYTSRYYCSDNISFNSSTGVISMSGGTKYVNMSRNDGANIVGKYFRRVVTGDSGATDGYTTFRFVNDSKLGAVFKSTATSKTISGNYHVFSDGVITEYIPRRTVSSQTIVESLDPNAYPTTGGIVNNVEYEYIGAFGLNIEKMPKVEVIDVVGTGTESISFTPSFLPKVFFCVAYGNSAGALGATSSSTKKTFAIGIVSGRLEYEDDPQCLVFGVPDNSYSYSSTVTFHIYDSVTISGNTITLNYTAFNPNNGKTRFICIGGV